MPQCLLHRFTKPSTRSLVLIVLFSAMQLFAGLTGQYYDTATFATLKTTRTDAVVDFNWGTAIPSGTAITNADTFSVAWSGQLEPEFSENYTFYVTADDGAQLWVDDKLVAARSFFQSSEMRAQVRLSAGQRVNVRLEYVEQTGNASVRLEWSCASRAREVIPSARLFPARVDKAGGSLLKEHWSGLAGTSIATLTGSANFPSKPGGREMVTSFECLAQDWADNYGTRVTGFIVPPVSGNFTFAVSGDDTVQLFLSTDSKSANKALLASVTSATGFRQWTAQPSQQSAPVALVQGQRYYVELLHKEGTGTDHWSVGWQKPGDAAFSVVPASALVQAGLDRAQPAQAALLNTMAQEHPRIFATAERFAALRAKYLSATASTAKTWATNAVTQANSILTQPVNVYTPDNRGTILGISNSVESRMYYLGLAWWLTNDAQYAERAWSELEAAAAFPDWHPAHYLDTAEMTHAFAIGYDWFYNYWTPSRRDTIRNAIITKGLNVGLGQYTSNAWWTQSTANNWNVVCNGGMTLGALAVGTESESLVEDILNRALNSVRAVLVHFTTDAGNWYEGPGYWGYTNEYGTRMCAGLEWVLGSDFAVSNTRNYGEAPLSPIFANGSSNIIFNYSDAGAGGPARGAEFAWFARRFGQPLYNWWHNQSGSGGGALGALWQVDSAASLVASGTVPDFAFHGESGTGFNPQEMVTLRGTWSDSRATWVGVKAGEAGASHGNLDAGTFVVDALGKRWFHDLGGDDYALPGYFSDTPNATSTDRWDYYRMRGEGQNTLILDPGAGVDQVLHSISPLIAYQSEPTGLSSFSIHDLTPAHTGATRVWRGVRLLGARDEVLVQDEIVSATGRNLWWFAHFTSPTTTVTIEPGGTSAMMQQGVERLWVKIVSGGGTFQIKDAVPLPTSPNPAGQNANTGHKKLAINLTGVTNATLAVWMVPLSSGEAAPTTLPVITALNTWNIAEASDPPAAANGNGTLNGDNAVDIDLRSYVMDDATTPEQMRFAVSDAVNGTVTLLADGRTARFTPTPGFTGLPQFSFTVTDTTPDARVVLAYDFDLPDSSTANTAPDVSGNARDGTVDFAGNGTFSLVTDKPAALGGQGGRSMDALENGTTGTRVQRPLSASELNWNTANWSVSGWFKRRDTTNDDIIWHISDGDGFGSNDELYLNCPAGQTTVRLQHYSAGGAAFDVDIAQTGIAAGVWHHFAVVRSGTSLALYVNGALAGTDTAFTLSLNQSFPVTFGGHASTTVQPGRWFDGQLDEFAVFGAALAPAEISTLAGGMTVRHFGGLSATGTITLTATPVTYNWTATTSGQWSLGTNWQSGTAPASSRGATVQFFNGSTLAGGSVAVDENLGANFQLNVLTLAGTASAASTVSINNGSLWLLPNGAVNPVVNLNATNGSGMTYDVNTPLTLGAMTTFAGSGGAVFRFNGNIDGSGGISKTGSSTLILTGSNGFAGDLSIASGGTVQLGNDGATGDLGSGAIVNNGTLRFDRTGTLAVPNTISGTGQVRVDCPISTGTVELTAANDFTGAVNINSGALRITNSAALGEGSKTITISNGSAGNPQLRLDGSSAAIELPSDFTYITSNDNTGAIINEAGDNLIGGTITLTSGGGSTRIVAQGGRLTIDANIAPNTTGRFLKLKGAATGVINGTIADGSATNVLSGVEKSDAGTWTLNGALTHTGNITCIAGTLFLNGAVTTASSVSASSGTTFGGGGSVNAATTISGNHEPGPAGPGTQTFASSVSYGNASRVQWEPAGNTTAGGDFISAGTVSITSGAAINVQLARAGSTVDFADPFWATARTFAVLTFTSRTGTFALGTVSADSLARPASAYGSFALQHTATAVNLTWTPRPCIEQWRYTWFGVNNSIGNAADLADPNGDGESNLLEFATAQSPLAATRATPTLMKSGASLEFTYMRSVAALTDGAAFTVEWRDSLSTGAWSSAGVTEQTLSNDGTIQTVRATLAAGPGLTRFVRLRVTK